MPYGFPRGAASKDVLRGVLPDGDFSRSAGPHRPCSSAVCCAPHVSCPQRGLTTRRRAADLWSIRRCLCSRADKSEPVCRICRERSPSVTRRFQPDWGCSPGAVRFRTTPSACRGVSERPARTERRGDPQGRLPPCRPRHGETQSHALRQSLRPDP